jgi:general secretion pathway protein M
MILKRWQHAGLSLLILIALIVLVIATCINPAMSYYKERRSELRTQQERLLRYQVLASQKDKLIPFYKQELSKEKENESFLPAMASSIAAARLQQQVKSLLAENNGQLISTQPLQAQSEGVFTPVLIRIHMKSDISALLYVLHNLESSLPLAFIENLQIQRIGGNFQNNNRNKRSQPNPLDTRFNLKVYMLNNSGEK